MTRKLCTILLILSALCLLACGGLMGDGSNNPFGGTAQRDGLRFSPQNPATVTAGSTVDLIVESFVGGTGEAGAPTTITLSTLFNATIAQPSVTQVLPASGRIISTFRVTIPATATVGSNFVFTAERTPGTAGLIIQPTSSSLTVVASGIRSSLAPATVSASVGGTATGTLTVERVGGFTGTLSLVGMISDVVITPSTLTFAATGAASQTATVNYRIPSVAAVGVPVYVPVRATSGGTASMASFIVTPTAVQNQPRFTLSVSPANILISGGQANSPVTVTVTPVNGFNGNVTINMSLPGGGSLTTNPGTPRTVTITDTNATQLFGLIYTPGQGGAPIGTATVTATGNGLTQNATFQVSAS